MAFEVEALPANRNPVRWPTSRALRALFAAIADPGSFTCFERRLAGRIESACGPEALAGGSAAPIRLVNGGRPERGRFGSDLGRDSAGGAIARSPTIGCSVCACPLVHSG